MQKTINIKHLVGWGKYVWAIEKWKEQEIQNKNDNYIFLGKKKNLNFMCLIIKSISNTLDNMNTQKETHFLSYVCVHMCKTGLVESVIEMELDSCISHR